MAKRKIRLNITLDTTALVVALMRAMVAADILGRVRVLEEAQKKVGRKLNPTQALALAPYGAGSALETFAEILGFESVKPQGAIDFMRSLTAFTKQAWNRLAPQYRLAAFTVARVENLMVVEQTRELLAQALDEGWSQARFAKEANAMFDRAGVTRLNPYHLETVFQTNMQTAYQNGRAKQLSDPKVRRVLPFWQYRTQADERVRPNHAALDKFTARADDPVWGEIYPPNGFNCRCTVQPLLASEGRAALGEQINVPGRDRLPAGSEPDEGFERAPAAFLSSLAEGEEFAELVTTSPIHLGRGLENPTAKRSFAVATKEN